MYYSLPFNSTRDLSFYRREGAEPLGGTPRLVQLIWTVVLPQQTRYKEMQHRGE